ncbi:RagB/SusD family nutrient uptake outer membrane protein [Paraflavitalea soli]|uniref:RagB/SusD family nutrient uptake outer membrane protein n=1 Tax=Paraflavitalea soli TaxID=2315862 RepID=A0A3B7MRN9_9BACT|nr:RagB/SusD family nutrient uptake outer membrane protein [Paraflavitalea soli]AXY77172.1 RagB/SusD family nutrient uptake outer membrane protein [Paraflavitalea soli]
MKMKRIAWIAGLALIGVSCKKQLEILPSDSIVEETAMTTVPFLEKGMVGVYININGSYDAEIYATSLYSDEANLPTENNTGRGVIAHRWQTDPGVGEVTAAWGRYAFGVDRANRVIAAADKLTGLSAADAATRDRIKAEALAIRAFCEFQVLINYAENLQSGSLGVPYVTESKIQKPARLTVGEVFAKVNQDLTTAAGLMPASFTDNTRFTAKAISALQARVALYQKDWGTAITAATAAINAVPLATSAQYPGIWTDQTEAEVIWKHKRTSGQGRLGDSYYDRTSSKIMYGVSFKLLNTFAANDIRLASTVLDRGGSRYSVAKYIGGTPSEPGRADVKVFRTAEMYLIRAEAYAENNQVALGAADLNALRKQRIAGYVDEVFASKESLINAVILERFKELAFEGQRMNDLRRKLLPVTRLPQDAINASAKTTLSPTDKEYYYPIPGTEILANENMIQNPTYRQ